MESHARALVSQVFKRGPAGDIERDKFIREGLSLLRWHRHFAGGERVPDFAGQSELIAQGLQDRVGAGEPAGNKNAMNILLVLSLKKSNGIANFSGKAGQRGAANIGHSGVAFL